MVYFVPGLVYKCWHASELNHSDFHMSWASHYRFLWNGLWLLSMENLDDHYFSSANANSFLGYHWIYSLAIQHQAGSCTTLAWQSGTWAGYFPLNGWTKVAMLALEHEVAHVLDKK